MAPRVKVTREEIISTAIELVREGGEDSLNARAVASRLGCSTQPVFSNFLSMTELRQAVADAAYGRYLSFLEREASEGKYPAYKAYGMAYVRFAKEERELFKLLFMCDRGGKPMDETRDYSESVDMIMKANGVSRESASHMHLEIWCAVHGIATMTATSFLSFSEEEISRILTDVYQGVRRAHSKED